VNTARAKIVDRDAVVRALESGQLAGYAGDVWFPQPPAKDHPWRTMSHHGMTPHISGSSLSAQARYAAGTREILEFYFAGKPIRTEYLIVDKGKLAGAGAHSYTKGDVRNLQSSHGLRPIGVLAELLMEPFQILHERLRSSGGCQITFLYLCVVSEGLRSIKGRQDGAPLHSLRNETR
jgi:D-isomer specific 2-hydroxyacid dehydrogenase, NAD binding domain